MQDQTTVKEESGFFGKKRNLVISMIILPIILVVLFLVLYFYSSEMFKPKPKTELQAENRFEKTLHVVANMDYAPYSFIDDNGQYSGLDVELINEIANRLNMNLDLQLMDWGTANKYFIDNNTDIIMNVGSDLIVNNKDIIATLPTTEKQYVVYGRNYVSSVAELYGRRVVSFHPMSGLGLDDEIKYVNSYDTIFEGLKSGEYEFAICPIQVGTEFLEKYQIENVFPSYAVMHLYGVLAMHPKDTMLRLNVNAILIQMQQEGRLAELDRKWISHRYENMTLSEMIESRPWLVAIIASTFLFVLTLLMYILMQYKNAKIREAINERLQENLKIINEHQKLLKEKQKELLEEKTRAEENSKAKTKFLFNMSHDIRTPMNAIIGYIELAKLQVVKCKNCTRPKCPDGVPSQLRDFLQKIDTSSKFLLTLINDVLEMGRIENGKMELEPIKTDLLKVIEEAKDIFDTQMQTKNIKFIVDTSEIRDKNVICDQHRLSRILLNLISNAYKFTGKDGKISVKIIQLHGDEKFGEYELRVKDNGIGMSAEFAKKVFESFTRERTSTLSGIQGTGLGMAITKSIVDLMKGTIEVKTAPNEGTEFIIRVKFELQEQSEEANEKEQQNFEEEIDFSTKKILLVDDIEVNREIAMMLLNQVGFKVETAENGMEAVKKVEDVKSGMYDLILMDIQMPIMNGYEATQAIRNLKDKKLASIPIIAMTANAFSEDVKMALNAGMNEHISKPIDVPKMIEILKKYLRGK